MPATEEQLRMACCAATCLIVALLITGWALNSFSNSCQNMDSACDVEQKNQLQIASSGVIAAAAGIALLCFMFVTFTNKDDILTAITNRFGSSDNGFGNSFGNTDSIFTD
jgi:hypothetical protein